MGTKKGTHFGYQNLAAGTDFGTHFKRRFWYPFLVPKVAQILVPTGSCFEHPWPEYKPQARRDPTSVALHRRRSPRWSPTFKPLRCYRLAPTKASRITNNLGNRRDAGSPRSSLQQHLPAVVPLLAPRCSGTTIRFMHAC